MQFSYDMEKEEKSQRVNKDFWLQWGNRKRLRCVRVRDPQIISQRSDLFRRKITSSKDLPLPQSNHRLTRNSEAAILRSSAVENQKSGSPEKEDRYYTTRASVVGVDDNGKVSLDANCGEINNNNNSSSSSKRHVVWPKLYISLSSKEKEEDFMAMKGCKLPQRPKRRAKIIQRSLLLVSPGAWLSDMCQERYEVREKKSSKKRPRGLKAMGSMESDSD